MSDTPSWLTVKQTARRLQIDPETVRRYLRSGKLRGVRLGAIQAGWRIDPASIDEILSARLVEASA